MVRDYVFVHDKMIQGLYNIIYLQDSTWCMTWKTGDTNNGPLILLLEIYNSLVLHGLMCNV